MPKVENFYNSDFLITFLFGGGGILLFYATPIFFFGYFYMKFRGNNEEITIEGFLFRFIFYSIFAIIGGALIFAILSSFSFSSNSNAIKGLYYMLQIKWDNINDILNAINNNPNLLAPEKNTVKYIAVFLGVIKTLFNLLSVSPLIILFYLIFINLNKCKKQYEQNNSFTDCMVKKFFYIMLFLMSLFIIYTFADNIVCYLIKNYLNISIDNSQINGIYNTSKEIFQEVKNSITYLK